MTDQIAEGYALVRHKIVNEGWDYVTVITGPEGSGKSTLALSLAWVTDTEFDGARVAFHLDDLLRIIEKAPRASTVIFDEAVQGAYRREAMTTENRSLNKVAMVARARNLHFILCIPNFHDLDGYFRDHRARAWFQVKRRGHAMLRFPSRNDFKRDVFWRPAGYYDYGAVVGPLWESYQAAKLAYITRELKAASDPEAEKGEEASQIRAEAAQAYRDTVEAIRRAGLQGAASIMAWHAEMGTPIGKDRAAALNRAAWPGRGRVKRKLARPVATHTEVARKDPHEPPVGVGS